MDKKQQIKILNKTHMERWKENLLKIYGHEKGELIYNKAVLIFYELLENKVQQSKEILNKHLVYGIFPGLSLYEGLLACEIKQSEALNTIEKLFMNTAMKNAKLSSFFGKMPFFYTVLRKQIANMMINKYPKEGWHIKWVENSKELIAMDISKCFYYDILKSYGREELVKYYCKNDDYVFMNISPSVKWERKMTIGNGDSVCDFRLKKNYR